MNTLQAEQMILQDDLARQTLWNHAWSADEIGASFELAAVAAAAHRKDNRTEAVDLADVDWSELMERSRARQERMCTYLAGFRLRLMTASV